MKRIANYKRALASVRSLMSEAEFAAALRELDLLLAEWQDQPALLVLRGELIQLQDRHGPPLEEAAEALERAAILDERNADAWLELAHFQYAVEDDAKAAEKSFGRSVEASSQTLIAALLGRAAALEEMGRTHEAFDCLSSARNLQNIAGVKNGSATDEVSVFEQWELLVGGE